MNLNTRAYDQYKKTSVETMPPGKLLLMLYNGAIKDIDSAKKAITEKNVDRAHQEIMKTEDILVELMSTLNMDYDISHQLFSLYEYMYNQLIQANLKKDVALLNEVQQFMTELRDVWEQAEKEVNTQNSANNKTLNPAPENKSSMVSSGNYKNNSSSPLISSLNVRG